MELVLKAAESGSYGTEQILKLVQDKLKETNMIERVSTYQGDTRIKLQDVLSKLISLTQIDQKQAPSQQYVQPYAPVVGQPPSSVVNNNNISIVRPIHMNFYGYQQAYSNGTQPLQRNMMGSGLNGVSLLRPPPPVPNLINEHAPRGNPKAGVM